LITPVPELPCWENRVFPPVDSVPPELLAEIRAHPDFRAAVESLCARRVKAQAEMDAIARWMTRDLG
jgi:hypothetical protein